MLSPQRLFETDEHFRARLEKPEKRLFETDEHFAARAKAQAACVNARCIAEHDGRVAARCNEYSDLVGYGADELAAKMDLFRVIAKSSSR